MSDNLRDVYAVRLTHKYDGSVYYIPRSDVLTTRDMPKLWCKRADAERAADGYVGPAYGREVVRFKLTEVSP